jgi:hypothetical protein
MLCEQFVRALLSCTPEQLREVLEVPEVVVDAAALLV